MKRIPVWIYLVGAQALIALAQVTAPYTAIGFMIGFMGGAFWSILLVNAALLAMAASALWGTTPRAFIVIPAAVYLGFPAFFAVGLLQHAHHARQVKLESAARPAPPTAPGVHLAVHGRETAYRLTLDYKTGKVSEFRNRHDRSGISYQLIPPAECESISALRERYGVVAGGYFLSAVRSEPYDDYCLAREQPASAEPARVIHVREALGGWFGRRTFTSHFEIEGDFAGRRGVGGASYVLLPVPLPVIGCGLNSSSASWDCVATFLRLRMDLAGEAPNRIDTVSPHNPPVTERQIELLAAALNLDPRPPPNRSRIGGPSAISDVERAQAPILVRAAETRFPENSVLRAAKLAAKEKARREREQQKVELRARAEAARERVRQRCRALDARIEAETRRAQAAGRPADRIVRSTLCDDV